MREADSPKALLAEGLSFFREAKLGAVLSMIREALKRRAFYATEMAKEVSERLGMKEDDAKLMVNDCRKRLVHPGEETRMRFEREDGTSVVLYHSSPEEGQGKSTYTSTSSPT